jgi:hypothetical protein
MFGTLLHECLHNKPVAQQHAVARLLSNAQCCHTGSTAAEGAVPFEFEFYVLPWFLMVTLNSHSRTPATRQQHSNSFSSRKASRASHAANPPATAAPRSIEHQCHMFRNFLECGMVLAAYPVAGSTVQQRVFESVPLTTNKRVWLHRSIVNQAHAVHRWGSQEGR